GPLGAIGGIGLAVSGLYDRRSLIISVSNSIKSMLSLAVAGCVRMLGVILTGTAWACGVATASRGLDISSIMLIYWSAGE
ncbi:MAG: hypothetical protein ACM3IL_00375, partial [Deltaproteobacteria bacterium]